MLMEQSQRIRSAAPHQPQRCQQQQERKLPPIELLNEQQQEQQQIHPTQMSALLLPNTANNDAASHNNNSSMITMIWHGSPASNSSSRSSTTPGLRAMSTESTSSDGSSSHTTPSPQQLNATDDDSCQPENNRHDNNCVPQEAFLPWWATSQPQEEQQLPQDLSSYHQTEPQQQTPLSWSNSSATTTSLTGDELGSGTNNDNHNLLILRSLSAATAICQQQQQQPPDWRMSQKIHRPRPTWPANTCRPDPIQIEVPFLVNLTTHGPQELSTVYEEDAITQEEQQDKERPVQHSSSQSLTLQCPQACYASIPGNDPSCSYETDPNHRGPYHPAAQDFDHDGPFLSQALQLHVLEESRPVIHSDHHPYVYFSTDHSSVAGERPQDPPSCPLVRPQALRVVCPTTMMAPIVRPTEEGVPDLQNDNDDPASFWKDHDSHNRNHAIINNNNNEEYSY